MKVLHVIPSLSAVHGGPSYALPIMARSLAQAGVTVDVATTDDDGPGRRVGVRPGQRQERDGYGVFHFPKQTEFYKVSLPLKRWLNEHVADYDLVHIHALFSYSSWAAARACRRSGLKSPIPSLMPHASGHPISAFSSQLSAFPTAIPYILRPLGVLNQWGVKNRRPWLKSLSLKFVERPILRHAAAMHYTSRQEQREAEAVGATARAFVIPLGLDLQPFEQLPDAARFLERWPLARGRKLVLFLSRIDAKKGLEILLPAFAEVRRAVPDACLVIAGDGPPDYVQKCRALASTAGVADAVIWTGFLQGEDKLAAFAAAQVFVLPSYSENFGIALVEAMAAGLACVTTPGVAVADDVAEYEAGLVTAPEIKSLSDALVRLLNDEALRERLGANARVLAAERFSIHSMGKALLRLYEQIIPQATR